MKWRIKRCLCYFHILPSSPTRYLTILKVDKNLEKLALGRTSPGHIMKSGRSSNREKDWRSNALLGHLWSPSRNKPAGKMFWQDSTTFKLAPRQMLYLQLPEPCLRFSVFSLLGADTASRCSRPIGTGDTELIYWWLSDQIFHYFKWATNSMSSFRSLNLLQSDATLIQVCFREMLSFLISLFWDFIPVFITLKAATVEFTVRINKFTI